MIDWYLLGWQLAIKSCTTVQVGYRSVEGSFTFPLAISSQQTSKLGKADGDMNRSRCIISLYGVSLAVPTEWAADCHILHRYKVLPVEKKKKPISCWDIAPFFLNMFCCLLVILPITMGFPGGAVVKKILLPMQEKQEMRVRSLGWEDPLEKDMATHSRILA